MAIAAAIFTSKLLFWSLIISSNTNLSAAFFSSSVPSSLLHQDNGKFDFENKQRNKRQLAINFARDGFRGSFASSEKIELKHSGQEVSNGSQRYDYTGSVENLNLTKSRTAYHSYRRPLKSTERCIRYSEKYLYQLLERSGMLNQWFMANNPEEAGRNFVRSYKYFLTTKFDHFDLPHSDSSPSDIQDTGIAFTCNDLCQSIVWKLREALAKEKSSTLTLETPYLDDDAKSHIISVNSTTSSFANCQLGMFIPVAKCIEQGEEEFEDHSKLCTSCQGIYMLDKMCFPRFINAIRCESQIQASGCVYDKISLRGSEECQKWQYEYIQVPASCECQLDVESLLLSAAKP